MKHLTIILTLLAFHSFGQEPIDKNKIKIDSLIAALNTATHDTIKLISLDALAVAEKDPDLSTGYDNQLDSIANIVISANPSAQIKNICKKYLSNVLYRKGTYYNMQSDYPNALGCFSKCLELREERVKLLSTLQAKQTPDSKLSAQQYEAKQAVAWVLINIGIIYDIQGEIINVIDYYNRSLKISEEIGDKMGISRSLQNIGMVYSGQGDYTQALEYYNKSLLLKEELAKSPDESIAKAGKGGMSICLNNIGIVYSNMNDVPKALEYYNKSLIIKEELGDKKGMSKSLNNIGMIYESQAYMIKDPKERNQILDKALENYNESLKIKEDLNDKAGISMSLCNIGNVYMKRKQLPQALECFLKAYKLAQEIGYVERTRDAAKLLEEIYAKQGNYKLSHKYLGEYFDLRDSILKDENEKAIQKKYFQYQYEKKAATDSIAHSKEMEISNLEISRQKAESKKQKIINLFVVTGLLLVIVIAVIIFRSLRTARKQKKIIEKQKLLVDEKNFQLNQQNEEITTQRDEIEYQRDEIESKRVLVVSQKEEIELIHSELTDSIHYASHIQGAVLPNDNYLKEIFFDYFILYKPQNIVSGDFTWVSQINNQIAFCVADCTGHGVPGGFMSMLGIALLNEIVRKSEITQADQVLNELRKRIIESLKQKDLHDEIKNKMSSVRDGMDLAFCILNNETLELQFAGANNPLYIIKKSSSADLIEAKVSLSEHAEVKTSFSELTEVKADKMPISIYVKMQPFTNHRIQLEKGDTIYLLSDGYQDQVGGLQRKKFLSKNLKNLLVTNNHLSMSQQKEILDTTIADWIGNYKQIDDITIFGVIASSR